MLGYVAHLALSHASPLDVFLFKFIRFIFLMYPLGPCRMRYFLKTHRSCLLCACDEKGKECNIPMR